MQLERTDPWTYLPVPGGGRIGLRFIELPKDRFVRLTGATDRDFTEAAGLARKRLPRCKPRSANWQGYSAVIAEDQRRRRAALRLITGGRDARP